MKSYELEYAVTGSVANLAALLPDPEQGRELADQEERRVLLGPEVVRIDDKGRSVTFDFRTDERLFLDHDSETYQLTRGVRTPEASDGVDLELTDTTRPDDFGAGVQRLSTATVDGWSIECWSRPFDESGPALAAFWSALVPGAGQQLARRGLPAAVRARRTGYDEELRFELQAVNTAELPTQPTEPPGGYVSATDVDEFEEATTELKATTALRNLGSEPNQEALYDALQKFDVADDDRLEQLADILGTGGESGGASAPLSGTRTRTMGLTNQGPDCAWVTDQAALDQARAIVDEISGTFTTFTGGSQPDKLHIDIDWWQQLESALTFSDTNRAVDAIKRLWLYSRVLAGEGPFDVMTQNEVQEYNNSVQGETERALRLINFLGLFSESRLQTVADDVWSDLTSPLTVDLGPDDIHEYGVANLVDVHFRDMDAELRVNGASLLSELSYTSDGIRVAIDVPKIRIDFEYETDGIPSAGGIACGILTLGACTALLNNKGTGYVSVSNAHLVATLKPTVTGDTVEWEPTLDRQASNIPVDLQLYGSLPGMVLSAVYDTQDVFKQRINDRLISELASNLSELPLDITEGWPTTWHAANGPIIGVDEVRTTSDGGVLGGEVAQNRGSAGSQPAPVSGHPVSEVGYAFAEPYLTAWVIEHTGTLAAEATAGDSVREDLDVTLPEPESMADSTDMDDDDAFGVDTGGGLPGCQKPTTPPPQYDNRTTLVRDTPEVRLPTTADPDHIGTVVAGYTLSIRAIKTETKAQPYVEPPKCADLDVGIGGRGPQLDPMPYATAELGGDHRRFLGRSGSRVGEKPRERARFELAHLLSSADGPLAVGRVAERGRNRRGFGGDGFPRPDDDGPGGYSPGDGFPFPGNGPGGGGFGRGLPDRVCEPMHCRWFTREEETTLETYLRAEVTVAAPLTVGFRQFGELWYPEVQLGWDRSLDVSIDSLQTDGPVENLGRERIRGIVREACAADVETVLNELPNTSDLSATRQVIPDIVTLVDQDVPQAVLELLSFDGADSSGDADYALDNDHAYWPITIDETLRNHIA